MKTLVEVPSREFAEALVSAYRGHACVDIVKTGEEMTKSKQQGTAWESQFVARAKDWGLHARRLAEGGSNDIGDVFVTGGDSDHSLIALAWKRLTQQGGSRRKPDGEADVVIITVNDFLRLLIESGSGAIVECKATERLNVTRALDKARKKVNQ